MDRRRHLIDKSGLVLDLGQYYTKIGMTGEPAPTFIIPTDPNLFLSKLDLDNNNNNTIYKQLVYQDENFLKNIHNFFDNIFLIKMSTDPTNRIIYIVCNMMIPKKFLEIIQKVLLTKYKLSRVFFINSL